MSPENGAPDPMRERLGATMNADDWIERMRRARDAPPLGEVGPYVIEEEVGRGGQGVVYRARRDDRLVAMKRLLRGTLSSDASRDRFRREIELVRVLRHDGIARVVDVIEDSDPPYLVLDWVDGLPANEWAAGDDRRRAPREIVMCVRRLCDAVLHAHQRGIIHRDLKPSNVLVDATGAPHLLDLGLAKPLDGRTSAVEVISATTTSTFLGTIAYSAPEQLMGDATLDVRTDVYAIGVLLFEMLTGELPYPVGPSLAAAVHSIALKTPDRPSARAPGIDPRLDAIVAKALSKAPGERYASVDALARDLDRFLSGDAVSARSATPWQSARRAARQHPRSFAAVTALSVVVVAFAITMAGLYHRAERSARRATRVETFLGSALSPGRSIDGAYVSPLDHASERAANELAGQPEVELGVRRNLARRFEEIGRWDRAGHEAERALTLATVLGRANDAEHYATVRLRGIARVMNDEPGGIDDLELARAGLVSTAGPRSEAVAEAEGSLAFAWGHRMAPGDSGLAVEAYEAAISIFEEASERPNLAWTGILFEYAAFRDRNGDRKGALVLLERARDLYREIPGARRGRLTVEQRYGELLVRERRWEDAEAALRAAIALREGRHDTALPPCYANLASTFLARGRNAEAIHFYVQAIIARCNHLSQTIPDSRAELQHIAARLSRDGLTPELARAFLTVVRDVAPWVEPLFRTTAGQVLNSMEHIGQRDRARGIRAVLEAEPRASSL